MRDIHIETLPVTAADGITHEVLLCAAPSPGPVALLVPAMGVPAKYYEPFLRALAGLGVCCAAMELRGTGSSTIRASRRANFGYDELVRQDIPAAQAAVAARFGTARIHAIGHSLGGQLLALALARDPAAFASLVLVASGSVDHRGFPFPKRYSVLAQSQLANAIAQTLGWFPGHRLGFGGLQPRRLVRDWSRQIRTGVYAPVGPTFDYEAALRQVAVPVLGLGLLGDTLTTGKATDLLCSKLAGCAIEREQFDAGLDVSHGDAVHFRWARQPERVAQRVAVWLRLRAPGGVGFAGRGSTAAG
ncbi:MAG: alpha/beta fold hydrolase [Deltaproteobacteria bacterium]|nr:alpha/beta fold hydrolase [Deltaproteobacteria bacterium]